MLSRRSLVAAAALVAAAPAVTLAADAHQAAHTARHGVHGMALFGGREALYASHLPMFQRPHDVQLLWRLRIADPKVDGALRAELAREPALWTLVPERFDLSRLAPDASEPLRTMRADLVRGHFERGGQTVYQDVQVEVERVLLFRPLKTDVRGADSARYMVLGETGSERFLVKLIDARPDFDHIVALSAPAGSIARTSIDVPRREVQQPADAVLQEAARAVLGREAGVRATVYFDTADLR